MARTEWYTFYQQQLQSRYEQQSELLRRLRKDYVIVTDPAVKFEREQQIQGVETEFEQIKQDLTLLETALDTGDDHNVPPQYKRKPKAESRGRENLLILLQHVKDAWIEGVLKQSLHNEVLIELGKTRQEDAVDKLYHPFNLTLKTADAAEQTPVLDGAIREIYEEAEQTLLILGAPGAGKTIMLLDLTRQLANDATFDPNQAIPVVFNLSSWTNKRQPIAAWLVDELLTKYRIPTKIGRKWVEDAENRPLVFLLDGLDEVALDLQPACVQAINKFREETALSGIVVACREAEYHAIAAKLKLEQALCVKPLTDQQIENYLAAAGDDLAGLCAVLPEDTALQELARSPLMLSMMSLAYHRQPPEAIRQDVAGSAATRTQNLFATYVQRMFQRPRRSAGYTEEKTLHWLTYLAHNMYKHGQTIFQMENLQPSWLLTKTEFWLYSMFSRLWGGVLAATGLLLLMHFMESKIVELLTNTLGIEHPTIFLMVTGVLTAVPIGLIDGRRLNWTRRHQKPKTGFRWIVFNILYAGAGVALIVLIWMLIVQHTPKMQPEEYVLICVFISILFGALQGLFFGLRGRKQTILRDVQPVEGLHWVWQRFGLVLLGGAVLGLLHFMWLDRPYLALYNLRTAQQTILRDQTTPVQNVAFSPDGDLLVTTDENVKGTVTVWTRAGHKLKTFGEHLWWVKFSPDGTLLVALPYKDKWTVWTREGEQVKTFGDNLRWVVVSPDSALLVTTDRNAKGTVWTRTGHKLTTFGEHLWSVAFSPDSTLLVTRDNDSKRRTLWTREGNKLADFGDNLRWVEFSPDSTLIVTTDQNDKRTVWTREGQPLTAFGDNLRWVAFSPDDTLIVTTDQNDKRTVWTREGQPLTTFGEHLWWVKFSLDGTLLVTSDQSRKCTLWTREGHKLVDFGDNFQEVEFSPDNTLLVTIDQNRKWTLWTRGGCKIANLGEHLRDVAFSPDGNLLVTRDSNGKGTVWTREGCKIASIGDNLRSMKLSPDGCYAVLSSSQYNFGPLAIIWVVVAFVAGLLASIRTNTVEQSKNRPNEGIWLSLKNSLLLGFVVGVIVALIFLLAEWLLVFFDVGLLNTFGLGLLCSLPVTMWFGLLDFLQHFTLRFILWARGYAPWRYARFLDHATDRIFLRKVGGGYIFVHRLLLEYFAAQWDGQKAEQ